jgi:hypothetical protein
MSRKTENYKVPDEGRDFGKVFVLTEMPASRSEAWAMRALFALLANNADIPPNIVSMGMAGMAQVGIKALSGLRWEVAEPLLAEMWSCVQFMPDPSKPHIVRPLIEEDIEELITRVKLRGEVWKLHADFLKAVAPSILENMQAAATPKRSRNTKTSRRQLPL